MSQLTVNRQGAEVFQDNDRGYDIDYAAKNREFSPPKQTALDWRSYVVIVAGTLSSYVVLFIVYHLWKLIYCWPQDRFTSCQIISSREPYAIALLLLLPLCLCGFVIVTRAYTRMRQDQAIAHRTNLVLNRYGDPIPADLYNRVSVDQMLQMLMAQYVSAATMETAIAQHKIYKGVNSLSNSNTYNNDAHDIIDALPIANAMLPLLNSDDPMIKHLIQRGLIDRSGNSLLVGFSAPDRPHYIELDETGLIALAGMPRAGKSNTALFLTAQLALIQGSQIIVCDKHGKKEKGLLQKLAPIAHTFARRAIEAHEIVDAIDYWHDIGSQRLQEDSTKLYPPCFIIIDEFTALILLELLPLPTLHKLISGGIEFPGVQCHGLIIGHSWTGKMLGTLGATTRRATTQRLIHRIDPQEAGFLIDQKFAKQTLSLADGSLIFVGASQPMPTELRVPFIDQRDLAYIVDVLPGTQNAVLGADVPDVLNVPNASESNTTSSNMFSSDQGASVDPLLWDSDPRTRVARDLLSKRASNGDYTYSYRAVQVLTNLSNNTIVSIAALIGRGNGRIQ